jgi:hypothetical protein
MRRSSSSSLYCDEGASVFRRAASCLHLPAVSPVSLSPSPWFGRGVGFGSSARPGSKGRERRPTTGSFLCGCFDDGCARTLARTLFLVVGVAFFYLSSSFPWLPCSMVRAERSAKIRTPRAIRHTGHDLAGETLLDGAGPRIPQALAYRLSQPTERLIRATCTAAMGTSLSIRPTKA